MNGDVLLIESRQPAETLSTRRFRWSNVGWCRADCRQGRIVLLLDGDVADREDADRPSGLDDRQSPDCLVPQQADGGCDLIVGRDGGEVAATDVAECRRARVSPVGDPP